MANAFNGLFDVLQALERPPMRARNGLISLEKISAGHPMMIKARGLISPGHGTRSPGHDLLNGARSTRRGTLLISGQDGRHAEKYWTPAPVGLTLLLDLP